MKNKPKLLDGVALTRPVRSDEGVELVPGQAGVVVEEFPDDHFLVEFADARGQTYALATVAANDLLVLHHEPVEQAA